MGGQTKKEQLIAEYSKETFDPRTRIYGFKDGKMCGFITCSRSEEIPETHAYFEFPFVLPGEDQLESLLINKALEVLRNLGIKRIIARAGPYWGHTEQLALEHGFENDRSCPIWGH